MDQLIATSPGDGGSGVALRVAGQRHAGALFHHNLAAAARMRRKGGFLKTFFASVAILRIQKTFVRIRLGGLDPDP